jgi:hypothetical protein
MQNVKRYAQIILKYTTNNFMHGLFEIHPWEGGVVSFADYDLSLADSSHEYCLPVI